MSKYSDDSYRRYRQYRANRHQYKVDQVAFPIVMLIIIGIVTKYKIIVITIIALLLILRFERYWKSKHQKVDISEPTTNTTSTETKHTTTETVNVMEVTPMKTNGNSTETGYINKNNQKNNGKTSIPGNGNNQWFYDMECLNCGHKYHANGHDIWLRKCPNCQGGKE